jgi:hypothetical protein
VKAPPFKKSAESTVFHIRHWSALITPSHRKKQKSAKQRWGLLDEIAVKKGHQYETVLMDAKAGSVMGMHADRQCDSAINLLNRKILSKEMVQTVILDM